MIYQHRYFQLDTDSKKVFDENGKELALTGNAYRMLVFLCANKNANLTQIGEFLDWAKDYSENHLRQYRYKINTIVSKNVVEYKNGVYSLVGEAREADKLAVKERNTNLLQADPVKSEASSMENPKEIKFNKLPAIFASILLLLTFFNWPYAFYIFLRIAVTGVAVYYAYYLFTLKKQDFWFWTLVLIAILFNPFIPIYINDKSIWGTIDVITAIFFVILINKKMFNSSTKEKIIESISSVGILIIQLGGFVLTILAVVYLFQGKLFEKAMAFLVILNSISFFIFFFFILILLPLAIFKKTRLFSGVVMLLSSYAFGLDLWIYSAIAAYVFWGWLAFFIGIFLAGVGVLPIAMLASIFHGDWATFGELVLMTIITFSARFLGIYLIGKAEQETNISETARIETIPVESALDNNITNAEVEELFKDENADNNLKASSVEDDGDDEMYAFCKCGKKLVWKKTSSLPDFCKYCGNKLT